MRLSGIRDVFFQQLKNHFLTADLESNFNILSKRFLGMNPLEVERNLQNEIAKMQQDKFLNAIERLKKHEPIQYIIGEIEFFGRSFKVNSNVHVPRPETETLVNWVLEDFPELQKTETQISLLDIGTGCGLLSITLAKELPQLKVWAIDISEKALAVVRENAKINKAEINLIQSNILELNELPQSFDIIVSNPPYVLELAKRDVQRKTLDFEPAVALYVKDKEPMVFNRKIAALAQKNLSEKGAVYVEINTYLGAESQEIFKENGFKTQLRKDIFGNDRTIKAFR